MEGKLGLGRSSAATKMTVVSTPSQELALTNFSYCSPRDLRKFAIPGSSLTLVLVGDAIVLSLSSHNDIADGRITLNGLQRRHTKVSAGDQIFVMSFFPPDDFALTLLMLEVDYVKAKANRNEELDAVILSQFAGSLLIRLIVGDFRSTLIPNSGFKIRQRIHLGYEPEQVSSRILTISTQVYTVGMAGYCYTKSDYESLLRQVISSDSASERITFSRTDIMNVFGARLSDEEAENLSRMDEVLYLRPNYTYFLASNSMGFPSSKPRASLKRDVNVDTYDARIQKLRRRQT